MQLYHFTSETKIQLKLLWNIWLGCWSYFVLTASQYSSVRSHQCASMSEPVFLATIDGALPPVQHTASSSPGQWFSLMAPSGGDAWGNGKQKEEDISCRDWWDEGVENRAVWRKGGVKGDDWPPGTWLKCFSSPNLLLYFEKQQEGCRSCKAASDGWRDTRALTDLMNGLCTLAKWLNHHERDKVQQKRQRTFHYLGTIALTQRASCHGAISELLFAQKHCASSGLMWV